MRRLSLLLLALTAVAAQPAAASSTTSGARFAKTRITFKDTSSHQPAVARAIELWNRAATGVRLVPARTGKKPDISILTRPRLVHRGVEVSGLGGGTDRGKRRLRGRVQLSAKLGDGRFPTAEQVNVAAHEIGHALGLGHSMGACDLMNPAGTAENRGCAAPAGSYHCGPQPADATALARLYRKQAGYPAGAGLCQHLPIPLEILAPGPEVTVAPGGTVRFEVRNTGSRTWGRYDLSAGFVDAQGAEINSPCSPDAKLRVSMNEESVPPGAVASFDIPTCAPPGGAATYNVRALDGMSDRGREFPTGPIRTFTARSAS